MRVMKGFASSGLYGMNFKKLPYEVFTASYGIV